MEYSIKDMRNYINQLSGIFDEVRLVNPVTREVLIFLENDEIASEKNLCHKVWSKDSRCQNCVSIHALNLNQRMTKFEFVNDEVYYIVANPIQLVLQNREVSYYIMEIVTKMKDEILFKAFEKNEFANKISTFEKKIYEDSLTKAYNRRYFDERMFLYYNQGEPIKEIAFVMVDLHDFKGINDSFGHANGDDVLVQTTSVLQSCIRESDSVVRLGGDEFLIILTNCDIKAANRIIDAARDKMATDVKINQCEGYKVTADFGVAHSSCFKNTPECIKQLMEEADKKMYLEKNGICLWEAGTKE